MISGIYTGTGSRDTPLEIRELMVEISMHMQVHGYTLRTGAVSAADRAFETGAGAAKEVYVPWNGWNERFGIASVSEESRLLAKQIWDSRKDGSESIFKAALVTEEWNSIHPGTQDLLAKAVCMILGQKLDSPTDALICWTPDCRIVGNTSHAMVLAMLSSIPVFNLCDPETLDIMKMMLRENRDPSIIISNRSSRCLTKLEISGRTWG